MMQEYTFVAYARYRPGLCWVELARAIGPSKPQTWDTCLGLLNDQIAFAAAYWNRKGYNPSFVILPAELKGPYAFRWEERKRR